MRSQLCSGCTLMACPESDCFGRLLCELVPQTFAAMGVGEVSSNGFRIFALNAHRDLFQKNKPDMAL